MDEMAEAPQSPVKDKNYDLAWVPEASLKNVWQLKAYIQDAERDGDEELAEWSRKIQTNNRKPGEQGKRTLAERLRREGAQARAWLQEEGKVS
jgi:hypothetical protein